MHPCTGILTCPVCGEPLSWAERALRCPRGHAFNRARQGYYHLLPVGHGRSGIRGDTREMVQARRRFLERGHFEPLSDAIDAAALRLLPARSGAFTAVEAGCGEGYYIGRLARAVRAAAPGAAHCFIGVDVSKEAVKLAARTHGDVCFVVNDVKHRLTVADGRVDVLLDVFAPRNPGEFARVVRPGGLLLVALPREDHLAELRARLPLLGIEAGKRARAIEQLDAAFELEAEQAIGYRREMAADEVLDLLGMTPNAWHLGPAARAEVAGWGSVPVTVSVLLLCFRRRAGA
ncbi:MAG TPA: methyltransferase domain-containing protein [Longimicrobiales bacterium]